ncbi:hypothetical protein DFH07DRAFT_948814 [Mycena maculata]|uniref:Uncharacterized protein n=1 Tax=Mycena maculata TaxID=230809 RepID=A0AAD7P1B3_9AGAR|nr:hypothetical protein DFH07DRAFT_948814 [Mycena maculata]
MPVPNAVASSSRVPVEEAPSNGGGQKSRKVKKQSEEPVRPPPTPPPTPGRSPRVGGDPPSSDGPDNLSDSYDSSSGGSSQDSDDSDFQGDPSELTAEISDRLQAHCPRTMSKARKIHVMKVNQDVHGDIDGTEIRVTKEANGHADPMGNSFMSWKLAILF